LSFVGQRLIMRSRLPSFEKMGVRINHNREKIIRRRMF
jgi:hypothetical protein